MFCKKCGTKQGGGDKFCRKCGTQYAIVESSAVVQTVSDNSDNEIENQHKAKNEAPCETPQVEVHNSSNESDENKLGTPLVRDDETINDDAKFHSNNENEDASVQQLSILDNTFIEWEEVDYQQKANKIKMRTKIVAIASCLIFFVLKAGFAASIWWWLLAGVIIYLAFMKIDNSDKKEIVKLAKIYFYVCIAFSSILLLSEPNKNVGKSHSCVGEWHASFLRDYNSSVRETWDFKINSDGTCSAREVGSGDANYEEDYEGNWFVISDDIIQMEMSSAPKDRKHTYSQNEIDKEVAKAQTPWAEAKAYKRTSGTKAVRSSATCHYFLRSDGAIGSEAGLAANEPEMTAHKE